jgi:hypothetical protein
MKIEKSIPWIRMEEEEESGWAPLKPQIGFAQSAAPDDVQTAVPKQVSSSDARQDLIRSLAEQRIKILDNDKLSARHKRILLDENRKTLVVASGGTNTTTDSVVYGILVFGGVVLITLSLLTTYAHLPSEVTLSFVGTVMGGTIATIAQKLGKL